MFLDLDVWVWKTKRLARVVLQKSIFAEVVFLIIPESIFHNLNVLGTNFMTFVAMETGLKFHSVSG